MSHWDHYDNPYDVSIEWLDGVKKCIRNAGNIAVRDQILKIHEYTRPHLNRVHIATIPLFHVRTFNVRKTADVPSIEEDPSRDVAS